MGVMKRRMMVDEEKMEEERKIIIDEKIEKELRDNKWRIKKRKKWKKR